MPDTNVSDRDSWVHRTFGVNPAGSGAPSALASAGGFLKGVGEGVFDGAKDMVVGVYYLGKATVKEGYALATDAKERDRVGTAVKDGADAVGAFAEKAVTRPGEAAEDVKHAAQKGAEIAGAVAHKVAEDYKAAKASGHGAEFVGKGVGEAAVLVGSFFIPGAGEAKAATAAADAAKVAKAGAELADAAKVAEAAKLAEQAAAAAKAGKAAEAAQGAVAAGKAAEPATTAEQIAAKSARAAARTEDYAAVDAKLIEKAAESIKVTPRTGPPNPPRDFSALKAAHPDEFGGAATFKPKGMSQQAFDDFVKSPEGKKVFASVAKEPNEEKAKAMFTRLKDMMMSGAETEPKMEQCGQPLVKIVPAGRNVGPTSAFFSTPESLQKAIDSGKSLAEFFGLPGRSESATYDIYMIVPNGAQQVVVNTVAPTMELGGQIERAGGALQHLVLDRSQWSAPRKIGQVVN